MRVTEPIAELNTAFSASNDCSPFLTIVIWPSGHGYLVLRFCSACSCLIASCGKTLHASSHSQHKFPAHVDATVSAFVMEQTRNPSSPDTPPYFFGKSMARRICEGTPFVASTPSPTVTMIKLSSLSGFTGTTGSKFQRLYI